MSNDKIFYITTAIHYANGAPHIGHAYENILTDVMARFKRLDGYDVRFLTGTDEHGEKVLKTAEKNGMSAQDFTDQNSGVFRDLTTQLGMSNDDFIRTTEPRHYEAAQAIWRKLEANGDIYLGKYEGWYSIREEGYFTDAEIVTGEDGVKRSPNRTEVEWVVEESYFFKLSAYTDKLLAHFEAHPEFIQPAGRRNEVISFVKGGLRDLSISRQKERLSWGIPVPGNEDHVMYVWLDALTNYITGLGYPDESAALFQKFWPADFHVIGKDIIRFHCVYWPAFLMGAGVALPKAVFAHGFINIEGEKMSKSLGNVLSPDDLIERFGLDAVRYFLMRELPHGQDGSYSEEKMITRTNADLANALGNLVQRTLSMIHKNCDAALPEPGAFTNEDKALLSQVHDTMFKDVRAHADNFLFNRSLEVIWAVIGEANAYVDHQAPWALRKTDPERMKTVLYVLAEVLRCLGLIIQPVMPGKAAALLDMLGVVQENRDFGALSAEYALKAGLVIEKPQGLFPRIETQEEAA